MRMWKHDQFVDQGNVLLALLLAAAGWAFSPTCGAGGAGASFGINYGQVANNLPAPADVVTLIQSIDITKSKLYDANPVVLRTFGNTGISFIVGTANEDLPYLANPALAMAWVQENIAAHMPATHITGIVVGNEIFSGTDTSLMNQLEEEKVWLTLKVEGENSIKEEKKDGSYLKRKVKIPIRKQEKQKAICDL